jgi:3-oxoacyl-[acyl-carrier-protein] synthase-3
MGVLETRTLDFENIIKKIKADISKVPFSLNEYANTSSATIPNLMCHYYGENNTDDDISVIMAGFGIGLSLGIADAKINPINILPIISTDTKRQTRSGLLARTLLLASTKGYIEMNQAPV